MPKPRSIAIFDVAYLGFLATNVAGPFLIWSALTAGVAAQAHAGPDAAGMISGVLVAGIVLIALLGLALWWFVSRGRSNVARWVAAIVLALSLLFSVSNMAQAGTTMDIDHAVSWLGTALSLVALVSLFMPDARAWFADDAEEWA